MQTDFTPFHSLIGGGLIGLAAVLLMLSFGRILGATGIVAGLVIPVSRSDWTWRLAVVAGMVSAPLTVSLVTGQMPIVQSELSTQTLILGGVLVGIGATFGAGCPSGHGVCGLARLSPRSVAATLTFMVTAGITVFVIRHLIGA